MNKGKTNWWLKCTKKKNRTNGIFFKQRSRTQQKCPWP